MFADSSPQFGKDWLLSIALSIKSEALVPCMSAYHLFVLSQAKFDESVEQAGIDDELLNVTSQRHEAGMLLVKSLCMHNQFPMALGSGAGSMENKLRSLAARTFAESSTLAQAAQVFQRVRGMCVDMGTEICILDAVGMEFKDILPHWMQEAVRIEGGGDFVNEAGGELPAHETGQYAFRSCLLSAGTVHIFNNMAKDMDKALQWFTEWNEGCKAMAHMLHNQHLRTRIIGKLILETRHAHLEPFFKRACPKPIEWRWGRMAESIKFVVRLQSILPLVWDPAKFLGRETDDALQEEDKNLLNLPVLTKAIRSSKWWSYTAMLNELHRYIASLSRWAEGCPCHGWQEPLFGFSEPTYSESTDILCACRRELSLPRADGDGPHFVCPLKGKRAIELAAGDLSAFMREIAEAHFSTVVVACDVGLEAAAMTEVLNDFNYGKAYMLEMLATKLGHWQQLPWKLCALAHWDAAKAREAARSSLHTFDASPQQEAPRHGRGHIPHDAKIFLMPESARPRPSASRCKVARTRHFPASFRHQDGCIPMW
jgi:hypothetical protein